MARGNQNPPPPPPLIKGWGEAVRVRVKPRNVPLISYNPCRPQFCVILFWMEQENLPGIPSLLQYANSVKIAQILFRIKGDVNCKIKYIYNCTFVKTQCISISSGHTWKKKKNLIKFFSKSPNAENLFSARCSTLYT